jgi:hypothetical protein
MTFQPKAYGETESYRPQMVMALLKRAKRPLNNGEIAKLLDMDYRYVGSLLSRMHTQGLLLREKLPYQQPNKAKGRKVNPFFDRMIYYYQVNRNHNV